MGRGTNQIATIGNLQEDFGAFSSSTTPNLCPTYAEIIAEGLIVSTTLSNNRLVKYSLISAAVVPSSISLSSYSWNISASAASVTITVTLTNATGFTVTDNATWITTSKSGNNVTITTTANTSSSARNGVVTFAVSASQAGDGVPRAVTFNVTQARATTTSDPTITVYITNLREITEYYGSNGLDGNTYFRWSDGSIIDDDDLTYDLHCFDGDYSNTVTGTLSQWENFYNSIHGEDNCCLWNTDADIIAGPLYEGDCEALWAAIQEAVSNGDSECDFEFPFDLNSPSVTPASLSFSANGGSQRVTLKNGVLTSSSETLSWITLSGTSTGSTSVTITASANTSTSSRSGYVYISVNGTSCSVYVYQSGQSTTVTNIDIPITYSMDGWMSATNTEFDNSLSVTAYNTSTGATTNICSSVNIVDGYAQSGDGDRTVNLATLTIPESELSNWEIRVWGVPRGCSAGYVNICFWDEDYRYAACPDLNMEDWGGSLNSPVLKAPLKDIEDYGGCVDIYFWSAAVGGDAPNSNQSNAIGGTSGSSSGDDHDYPSCTLGLNRAGSWAASSKTSASGYSCYQSSGSYNVNNGLDIMRINLYNFGGQTFTIYIRSYAEGNYDYTAAGVLDTALSTSNTSAAYPKGSGTMPSNIKAWTRGNQQSGTALSNYTAVSYTIPDNSLHFIDIAYVKDGSGNTGDDRGYVLIPNTYLS